MQKCTYISIIGLLFSILLSENQAQNFTYSECQLSNHLCLPEEAPFGYRDDKFDDLSPAEIIFLADEALKRTIKPVDRKRYLLVKLNSCLTDSKEEIRSLIPKVITSLGFKDESEIFDHLEDISLMGLSNLYKHYYSEKNSGVQYHIFMNFASRAHVEDEFLGILLSDSIKSGKIDFRKSETLLRQAIMKMVVL